MSRRNNWRFSDETLTTVASTNGGRGGRAIGRKREPGKMNKAETQYAGQLELRRQVGEILWWTFEGMTFKINNDCYYEPDFNVMLASCELQCVDVKGTQKKISKAGEEYETHYTEDDARVKILAAAKLYPISFFIVYLNSEGNWITKAMG